MQDHRDPYIIHLNIALHMVVSLYFGGKSHVSNGQNVSLRSPGSFGVLYIYICMDVSIYIYIYIYMFQAVDPPPSPPQPPPPCGGGWWGGGVVGWWGGGVVGWWGGGVVGWLGGWGVVRSWFRLGGLV